MSGPPGIDLPNPTTSNNLDDFVNTPEFDQQCSQKARERALSSRESDSDEESLWSGSQSVSSATTADSSPHEVPRVEAHLYYAGVKPKGRGPMLVYRTSSDVFVEPSGPEAYRRLMRVIAVPDDHEFQTTTNLVRMANGTRFAINRVAQPEEHKITSVDFVRFTWLDKKPDQEIEEEEEENDDDEEEDDYDSLPTIKPVEYGSRHVTNPTIWVDVLPDTPTGAVAHESAKDIRVFLQVQDIDIACRESTSKSSKSFPGHGPALFPPVDEGDALEKFIGSVSVPLGLPIAGRKITMQGTLGPYFHVGNKLYAITVCHNLFLLDADNDEYKYDGSGPKKEVVVMRTPAFTNYLASIQAHIGTLNDSVDALQMKVNAFGGKVADGTNVAESQAKLEESEGELAKIRIKIVALKKFYVNMNKKWRKSKDRVIGFVAWAPSIGLGVPPYRYTRDLCVIELYKDRFKHMIGNVLSLGQEYEPSEVKNLLYDRIDVPSEFKYPENGLLHLRGSERIRRVLKRGFAAQVTVGTLTKFRSFVRKYSIAGNMESLELPILSHENETRTFSRRGDSGSLIVSAHGEFVGLLTGGSNSGTDGSDITFATLFECVWELVCAEFPGANLYFDDLTTFLADVA